MPEPATFNARLAAADQAARAPSRADKFAAQLTDKLAEFPDDEARRIWLRALWNEWQERYNTFQILVDAGRDQGSITAWDFVETLSVIERRMSAMEVVHAA